MCTQWRCMIEERFLFLSSMAGGEGQFQGIENSILNLLDTLKLAGHTSLIENILWFITWWCLMIVGRFLFWSSMAGGDGQFQSIENRILNPPDPFKSTGLTSIREKIFFSIVHVHTVMVHDWREISVLVKYGRGRRTVTTDRELNSESTRPLQINRPYFDMRKNLFFHCPCAHSDGAWLKRDFCSCEVWPGEKDSDNR